MHICKITILLLISIFMGCKSGNLTDITLKTPDWEKIKANTTFTVDDWDSWGEREIVIEPNIILDGYGTIIGVGEPTLTSNGDISFVVVYGDYTSEDETDVFDCDPWFLPKIP